MKKLLPILILIFAFSALSQSRSKVTRESGGSVQTNLTYGIVLNKNSSLTREWITVHDDLLPANVVGTVGIKTAYLENRAGGEYRYKTAFTLETRESLAAFEIRFLLFNIWGNHIKTLSYTEVSDIQGKKDFTAEWRLFSENEAEEFYASIAYLTRVRTQSGKVLEANFTPIVDEAKKFSKKFTAESLEPTTDKK